MNDPKLVNYVSLNDVNIVLDRSCPARMGSDICCGATRGLPKTKHGFTPIRTDWLSVSLVPLCASLWH